MKISIVGNCQVFGLAACVQAMVPDAEVQAIHFGFRSAQPVREPALNSDIILLQTALAPLRSEFWEDVPQSVFKLIPTFYYPAYHPDLVHAFIEGGVLQSAMTDYSSALVLYGWLNDLSVADTLRLFCEAVYDHLTYFDYAEQSRRYLIEAGARSEIDMIPLMAEWSKRGCFAHSVDHPKLFVSSSIVRARFWNNPGVKLAMTHPEDFIHDALADGPVSGPVYPEIGARFGIEGNIMNLKIPNNLCRPGRLIEALDLEHFVEGSYACSFHHLQRLDFARTVYRTGRPLPKPLETLVAAKRRQGKSNPYSDLPDYCFWRQVVSDVPASALDPVVNPKFQIAREDKISTAGSCFAQHIAKTLVRAGYNYFIAESAPLHLATDAAAERGYGLFSARFGNIYSARQLLQLFDRAYLEFSPNDICMAAARREVSHRPVSTSDRAGWL